MTSSAPPATAADPVTLDALGAQIQSAIAGIFALDPQQAAIRAGLSFLVLGGAALSMALLRIALRALVDRVAPVEDGTDRTHRRVGNLALGLARIGVIVGALYLLVRVWGVDFGLVTGGVIGAALANVARALIILVLAMGAIEVSGFAIVRVLGQVARAAHDPRRAAQVRTLAPVLKGAAQTVIVVLAAMMFLSQIGVEVGPLVAGAGIVGLAVGFGAQTIVKDFLTGVFLILEDIVSVGDIVQIGDFSGRVEEMTLRTIRLRDYDGTLHVFPYGEAQVIHNKSKVFSYFAFDLQISYCADADAAIDAARAAGETLRADPDYAPLIMAPVEIAGIDKLSDNGVMLKGRIKTQPGQQFKVGREYQRLLKAALDAAGVPIAHRHQPAPPVDETADRAKI